MLGINIKQKGSKVNEEVVKEKGAPGNEIKWPAITSVTMETRQVFHMVK